MSNLQAILGAIVVMFCFGCMAYCNHVEDQWWGGELQDCRQQLQISRGLK